MAELPRRHSAKEYAQSVIELFPKGKAFPRNTDSDLYRLTQAIADTYDQIDLILWDLLENEVDPRSTNKLLESWERAFGLPDPCVSVPQTLQERRRALVEKLTLIGGQSKTFFYDLAFRLGYVIRIQEYSPWQVGISEVGDTRPNGELGEQYAWELGPPETRYFWKVMVWGQRVVWFRAGESELGKDHFAEISIAEDLECLFKRYKPAHTEIIFDYAPATPIWFEYEPFRVSESHVSEDPLLTIITHGGDPLDPDKVPL